MCPHVKQAVSLKTIMVLHEMEKFELSEASIKIDFPTRNLKNNFITSRIFQTCHNFLVLLSSQVTPLHTETGINDGI